jgi:hypothetical protein
MKRNANLRDSLRGIGIGREREKERKRVEGRGKMNRGR